MIAQIARRRPQRAINLMAHAGLLGTSFATSVDSSMTPDRRLSELGRRLHTPALENGRISVRR
jgi:hypothetical protein